MRIGITPEKKVRKILDTTASINKAIELILSLYPDSDAEEYGGIIQD